MKAEQLKRPKWLLILLIGAVILFLVGRIAIRWLQQQDEIHIALIAPFTGEEGAEAEASERAIRLFLEKFNSEQLAREGARLVLDVYDSKGDPELAEEAMVKVRASDAVAVIGPHSNEASMKASKAKEGGDLPVVTPCGVDTSNPWFFRTAVSENVEAQFLATYAHQVLRMTEVNVVFGGKKEFEGLYGFFESSFVQSGGKVVETWLLDPESSEDSDFEEVLAELKEAGNEKPVTLLLPPELAAKLVIKLRKVGLTNPVIGLSSLEQGSFVDGFKGEREESMKAGYFTDGCYLTVPFLMDNLNSEAFSVSQEYLERFGEDMDGRSMFAYDSAKVICTAIADASDKGDKKWDDQTLAEKRESLKRTIAEFNGPDVAVEGVTGSNYFHRNGSDYKGMALGRYRNGKITAAMGQLQYAGKMTPMESGEEAPETPEFVKINGNNYSETDVVYTGIEMLDIVKFDPESLDATLKFYLWFRFREGLDVDPTDITFSNSRERIEIVDRDETDPDKMEMADRRALKEDILGIPHKEDKLGMSYRRYLVEHKFKPNFLAELSYGKPVVGVSFHHDEYPRSRIQYVIDSAGGAGAGDASQSRHLQRLNAYLGASHRWELTDFLAYTSVNREPVLGKIDALVQGKDHLDFSEFVYAMEMQKSTFTIRNRMSLFSAELVLAVSAIVLLIVAFERRNRFLRTIPRVVMVFQILAIIFGLLSLETVLLSYFDTKLDHYQIDVIIKMFAILWWLAVAAIAIKIVARLVWDPLEEVTGNKVPTLIRNFVTGTVLLAVSFCIIAFVFNYKITSLLASSGVAAMILGLALQINLSNIVSGIALNMDRAFRIDDWLKISPDIEGKVLNIGWRATRIQTWDDCVLSIPNNLISESSIHNWSSPSEEFWLWPKVQIDPRHPPELVKKILKDAVLDVEGVCKDPEPEIYCEIAVW